MAQVFLIAGARDFPVPCSSPPCDHSLPIHLHPKPTVRPRRESDAPRESEETRDWKVPGTRRQESRRYDFRIKTPANRAQSKQIQPNRAISKLALGMLFAWFAYFAVENLPSDFGWSDFGIHPWSLGP